jgi:chromosome segregation ATPase
LVADDERWAHPGQSRLARNNQGGKAVAQRELINNDTAESQGTAATANEAEQELADVSAALMRATAEVQRLERKLDIGSPEFDQLADDIARLSRKVFTLATEQAQIGQEAPTAAHSIDDVADRLV